MTTSAHKLYSPDDFPPLTILTGHYGVGKTNLAINLALIQAGCAKRVTLVDMDIVNPYFRSSDYAKVLSPAGVQLVSPNFAGTSLDTPSLSPAIAGVLSDADKTLNTVIVDVGGDDAGATALGRYAQTAEEADYRLLYVVNRYRSIDGSIDEAVEVLHEIERTSHLAASAIVNNAHVQQETTLEHVKEGIRFAHLVADAVNLPLWAHCIPAHLLDEAVQQIDDDGVSLLPVRAYVHPPWE